MQQLKVFQSLWAMELRRPGVAEVPMEQKFKRAAEAGYHGLCIDPAVDEIEASLALLPLYREYGLACMVNAFPHTVEELSPLLDMAVAMDACLVNVIGAVMPMQVDKGVEVIQHWMADAQDRDVPVLFETHRDCTLNDLHYTLQLMQQLPHMRLCADLSHYVIDREMRLPLRDHDREAMDSVLQHSDCLQGRVSNAEQIQVPLTFPQHAAWLAQFRRWWRQGMAHWQQSHSADESLYFLCELGPPPYAITDAEGREMSDRWQEALQIREWVEQDWAALQATTAA